MYEIVRPLEVRRGRLPLGDAGTWRTLAMMRDLAHQGARDLAVRETAIQVLQESGAEPHDTMGEIGALHRFVRDQVRFVRDIDAVETLQSPRYTLRVMAGDCDDRATLLAALARSVGIPASFRFRVVAANPLRPRTFSHVYVVANVRGKDVALDPTYSENGPGWEIGPTSRVGDFAL